MGSQFLEIELTMVTPLPRSQDIRYFLHGAIRTAGIFSSLLNMVLADIQSNGVPLKVDTLRGKGPSMALEL